MVSEPTRWSAFAGGYSLLCGGLLLLPLGVIADTLLKILGLPTGLVAVIVPGTGALIGAAVWYAVIESRNRRTYMSGGIAGMITAFATVLFWALLTALVFGPSAILAAGIVLIFVLVVALPVAFVAAIPLMYVRRHFGSDSASQQSRLCLE